MIGMQSSVRPSARLSQCTTKTTRVCQRTVAPAGDRLGRAAVAYSLGKDVVGGWLDITKLVSGGGSEKSPYDELASAIGRDVYVDLAGWHLYLRDMSAAPGVKMHSALASQIGPQLGGRSRFDELDVTNLLKKVPIKLGAGKMEVSLFDVMPSMCVGDLAKICEDYSRNK